MGTRSLLAVLVAILTMISFVEAQQNVPPSPSTVAGSFPQAQGGVPNSQYFQAGQRYSSPPYQEGGYQTQNQPINPGTDPTGWPNYPYPQYHNPYYGGISTRDLISGTIDWFVSLPSTVFDRFSGFMDRSFFPQSPATQGGTAQSKTQTPMGEQSPSRTPEPLPPASVYTPGSR